MASGERKELFRSIAVGRPGRRDQSRRLEWCLASEPQGAVEAADVSEPLALELPADATDYGWLEVRTRRLLKGAASSSPIGSTRAAFGPRMISFKTLDRGETSVRLRVGACSQWRGYPSESVYLVPSPGQDIRGIRLVR